MPVSGAILTDQMQRPVELEPRARRILSLVPSKTELLFELGLGEHLVGRTSFCTQPTEAKQLPIVGGTKRFHFSRIEALQPDLIIGNKEENYKSGIEQLASRYRVYVSDVKTLEDASEMIQHIGELCDCRAAAELLCKEITHHMQQIRSYFSPKKVLYLIWRKPWMAAGRQTFIHYILEWTGLRNVLQLPRYPELKNKTLQPDYVFLSSEPYPFSKKHLPEIKTLWPEAKILLVDGTYFSWYGSRLSRAVAYLKQLPLETRKRTPTTDPPK